MIEDITQAIETVLADAGYTVFPFYEFKSSFFDDVQSDQDTSLPAAFVFGATDYDFTDGVVNAYEESTTVGIKLAHWSLPTDYKPIFDTAKRNFLNLVRENVRLGCLVNDWRVNRMTIRAVKNIEEDTSGPCYIWDILTTVDFIENGVA